MMLALQSSIRVATILTSTLRRSEGKALLDNKIAIQSLCPANFAARLGDHKLCRCNILLRRSGSRLHPCLLIRKLPALALAAKLSLPPRLDHLGGKLTEIAAAILPLAPAVPTAIFTLHCHLYIDYSKGYDCANLRHRLFRDL